MGWSQTPGAPVGQAAADSKRDLPGEFISQFLSPPLH